jgi:hypothetical protein
MRFNQELGAVFQAQHSVQTIKIYRDSVRAEIKTEFSCRFNVFALQVVFVGKEKERKN